MFVRLGSRGSLTKKLEPKFFLREEGNNQTFGLGCKEVWEIDPKNFKAGSIMHFSILTVHNSHPNFTDEPRRLMIYTHHPESWVGAADMRNGPSRLREAPYEREYLQACIAGKPGTRQYSLTPRSGAKL